MELEAYKVAFEQWILQHPMLSGLTVFLLTFLESVAVIGILLPGTILMTSCGALMGLKLLPVMPTLIWAMAGAVAGDGLSYGIGYYYKQHLRQMWPFRTHPAWLNNCESFFKRHGGKSVFLGRIGPLRAFIPLVAGMLHMRPLSFFAANIPAAIIWAPLYMLPGILLGLASLKLPPAVATKFLLILFILLALAWLSGWLLKRMIHKLLAKLDVFLDWVWHCCQEKRGLRGLYLALQDPYHPKRHGQLTSACILLLTVFLLIWLTWIVNHHNSLFAINHGVHFFFRSWYNEWGMKTAIVLTTLGEKGILLLMMIPITIYLFIKKQTYSAWHFLGIALLSASGIFIFKHLVQSVRPMDLIGDINNFSFPSGHTTLSVAVWGFIAVVIARAVKARTRWICYFFLTLVVSLVTLTRLYLGLHWFTDVLGGLLLGTSCLLVITISYRRLKTRPVNPWGFLLTCVLSFTVLSALYLDHNWQEQVQAYKPLWPRLTIDANTWWNKGAEQIPLFRLDRFGHPVELLNLQVRGDIAALRNVLYLRGWEPLDEVGFDALLHRLAAKPADRKLPLMPVTYLNHRSVLTMVKPFDEYRRFLVLRLWDADITFSSDPEEPLYLGTLSYFTPDSQLFWRKTKRAPKMTLPLPTTLLTRDLGQVHWRLKEVIHTPDDETQITNVEINPHVEHHYQILLIQD
ncbi:MAG: yabI [Gammaproteobacteria bacterium]|jgi:membrane protein DedA with SNARE-associated domain/membrane-associated phospholipid phosphatase|nr:yabI [Gammaproteobacteria bacterium]